VLIEGKTSAKQTINREVNIMQYRVLTPIKHDFKSYQEGDLVELSQADAKGLLASQAIKPENTAFTRPNSDHQSNAEEK
jgi:hypothetical protein